MEVDAQSGQVEWEGLHAICRPWSFDVQSQELVLVASSDVQEVEADVQSRTIHSGR